jgi:hypothetical protein
MPIFISHSHKDKHFVDSLAMQLVHHHVNVWLDRWELAIGDSIVEKVQDAIDESSALLVILSKYSVASEWCKKELNGGLLKELEEKRVFVMPVLVEDCEIPIFARGKLYADFRTSFDDGLGIVLEGIAKITNPSLARFKEPKFHIDSAEDWKQLDDDFMLRLTYIEQADNQPYTCLTTIQIFVNGDRRELFTKYSDDNAGALGRFRIVEALHKHLKQYGDIRPRLSDQYEQIFPLSFRDQDGLSYCGTISARRLGEDTGRDILIFTNNLVERTYKHMKEVLRVKN